MFTGGDWLLLLSAWGVVSVLVAAAWSVTAYRTRWLRRNYSLAAKCTCGHIQYDHSRNSGRCLMKADAMPGDFNCICMMFDPGNGHRVAA